jgi:riboflavin transporter FmnP
MKRKMSTRKMVYIGLLAAVATALMYLELPLTFLFMPPFLKLDISGVPTLIGTFMFGPAAGIFITLVKDLIHFLSSQTGGVGELSDFLIYATFSLAAGFIYRFHKSKKGALIACLAGTAAVTIVGALTNLFLIIPFYSKIMPIDAIVSACNAVNPMIDSINGYILFGAMPFNLIKGLIISGLTFLVYKKLSQLMKGSLPQEKPQALPKA